MLFCSVHGGYLKNTVEECHSSLLVELGRLVEECFIVEIVKAEDVGAALCTLCHDLGSVYLSELIVQHKLSESTYHALLELEDRTLGRVSQSHAPVVKVDIQ